MWTEYEKGLVILKLRMMSDSLVAQPFIAKVLAMEIAPDKEHSTFESDPFGRAMFPDLWMISEAGAKVELENALRASNERWKARLIPIARKRNRALAEAEATFRLELKEVLGHHPFEHEIGEILGDLAAADTAVAEAQEKNRLFDAADPGVRAYQNGQASVDRYLAEGGRPSGESHMKSPEAAASEKRLNDDLRTIAVYIESRQKRLR